MINQWPPAAIGLLFQIAPPLDRHQRQNGKQSTACHHPCFLNDRVTGDAADIQPVNQSGQYKPEEKSDQNDVSFL